MKSQENTGIRADKIPKEMSTLVGILYLLQWYNLLKTVHKKEKLLQ